MITHHIQNCTHKLRTKFVYNKNCTSRGIDADLKRRVSEFDITILEFKKITLNKQYQRYITLEEGKILFDVIPIRPHGEIVGFLNSMIARQVEGANYIDGLECASDNGMLFGNSPNGHRLRTEQPFFKRPDAWFHLH